MGCSGGGTMMSSCSGGGCCTPCSSSQQQHLQVNNLIYGKLLGTYRIFFKGRRYDLALEIMIINLCVKLGCLYLLFIICDRIKCTILKAF